MKRILLICAMVALVGCGKKETQPPSPPTPATPQAAETQAPELTPKPAGEPVQEESLVGTYQVTLPNGTFTLILLEDGKVMVEQVSNAGVKNPENSGRGTWIAKNGEVVVTGGDTEMLFKINPNGTLTAIANITNGKREDVPKELQKLMVLSKPLAVPPRESP